MHIPKTAGTSMRNVLHPYTTAPQGSAKNAHAQPSSFKNEHLGASEIKNLLLPNVWDTYYKFAFVRNPWALMLSHYLYFKRSSGTSELHKKAKLGDFTSYILWYFSRTADVAKFINGFSDFITIDSCIKIDYIGKYENLNKDFNHVLSALNIVNYKELPIKNTTTHGNYRTYYNCHTESVVKKAFEKHLDYFKYRF